MFLNIYVYSILILCIKKNSIDVKKFKFIKSREETHLLDLDPVSFVSFPMKNIFYEK